MSTGPRSGARSSSSATPRSKCESAVRGAVQLSGSFRKPSVQFLGDGAHFALPRSLLFSESPREVWSAALGAMPKKGKRGSAAAVTASTAANAAATTMTATPTPTSAGARPTSKGPSAAEQQVLPSKQSGLFKQLVKLYEVKQYKKGLKTADVVLKKFPLNGGIVIIRPCFYFRRSLILRSSMY
jgi:hypothetical protein